MGLVDRGCFGLRCRSQVGTTSLARPALELWGSWMPAGGSAGSGCLVSGTLALFLLRTSSFRPPLALEPQ